MLEGNEADTVPDPIIFENMQQRKNRIFCYANIHVKL